MTLEKNSKQSSIKKCKHRKRPFTELDQGPSNSIASTNEWCLSRVSYKRSSPIHSRGMNAPFPWESPGHRNEATVCQLFCLWRLERPGMGLPIPSQGIRSVSGSHNWTHFSSTPPSSAPPRPNGPYCWLALLALHIAYVEAQHWLVLAPAWVVPNIYGRFATPGPSSMQVPPVKEPFGLGSHFQTFLKMPGIETGIKLHTLSKHFHSTVYKSQFLDKIGFVTQQKFLVRCLTYQYSILSPGPFNIFIHHLAVRIAPNFQYKAYMILAASERWCLSGQSPCSVINFIHIIQQTNYGNRWNLTLHPVI